MGFIKKIITKLFCRFIGYYNGAFYDYVLENGKLLLQKSTNNGVGKLLIVTSANTFDYREESFPINDRKALKNLLKLKTQVNERAFIYSISDTGSKVGFWKLNDAVNITSAFIPETLLLSLGLPAGKVLELEESKEACNVYIALQNDEVKSSFKGGLINNVERFAISHGITVSAEEKISFSDKASMIFSAFRKLRAPHIVAFKPQIKKLNPMYVSWGIALPIMTVLSLYILLSSAYLNIKSNHLEQVSQEQRNQIGGLLEVQQKLDENLDKIKFLKSFIDEQPNIVNVWPVIAPLYNDIKIDSFQVKGGRIILRAEAESATKVLEELNESPFVQDAKFDSNISNTRRGERFTLSFKVNAETILNTEGTGNE